MQQTITWTLSLTILTVFGALANDNRAVAQFPDPGPIEEDLGYESELPAPPQAVERVERVERPRDFSQAYLGVTFDPQIRNAAVARSVTAGSPADLAGIKAGDTIVSVNGRRIASYDDVVSWVDRLKPGDVLDIDVSRRVSVRARAVLDGQPVGTTTSNYQPASESLPVPAVYRSQPPVRRVPTNVSPQRPRANYGAPQGGNNNVNRSNNANDRDRDFRGRGLGPRRRG